MGWIAACYHRNQYQTSHSLRTRLAKMRMLSWQSSDKKRAVSPHFRDCSATPAAYTMNVLHGTQLMDRNGNCIYS